VAEQGWTVTLAISQKPIADWARDPAVAGMAIDKSAVSTEPRTDHVVSSHYRGGAGVQRYDPMFVLPRGFEPTEGL
jgi:hypothetical protein